jgi:hypothetical protein
MQHEICKDLHCGVAIKLQKLLDCATCRGCFVKQFIVSDLEETIFSDFFSRCMDRFDTQRPLDQATFDRRFAVLQESRR